VKINMFAQLKTADAGLAMPDHPGNSRAKTAIHDSTQRLQKPVAGLVALLSWHVQVAEPMQNRRSASAIKTSAPSTSP
jgi:hypothetical protein